MKTNNVFKKQCDKYRNEIKGKPVRIYGVGFAIAGVGNSNLKLKFLAPKGISTKPTDAQTWVKWEHITKELMNQVSQYFPQTEEEFEEERRDYVQMLLEFEEQEKETEA